MVVLILPPFNGQKEHSQNRQLILEKIDGERAIFEYIEGFYNRKRLHSTLGYVSPEDFEKQYYEQWLCS